MGKAFGIAAFVFLLLSFPIPIMGNYLTLLALLIVAVAAYHRERVWTITVDVIAAVKLFLLSPTWHLMMFSGAYMNAANRGLGVTGSDPNGQLLQGSARASSSFNSGVVFLTLALIALPMIVLVWREKTASKTAV